MTETPMPPFPATGDATVRLRPWSAADAPALVRAWADTDVARFTAVPDVASPAAATAWIDGAGRRYRSGRAVDAVVSPVADDTVLGEVGLAPLDLDRSAGHLGFWVGADHRRRGVAQAAVALLVDWADDQLGLRAVVAITDADNHPSRRVLAATGFVEFEPDRWVRRG